MKFALINSLLALTLLCLFVNPLAAEVDHSTHFYTSIAPAQNSPADAVKYTSIDLSDPAVYAGKQFRIFVGLENTGEKSAAHTIAVYRKDVSTSEGKTLMSSKQLTITAGENLEVVFTLAPENLLVKGRPAPDNFVFIVGGEEIVVDYVK